MKNLIVLYLLGTLTGFCQKATINDISLSYDDKKDKMLLVIPLHNFHLLIEDNELTIYIYKEFDIKMVVNNTEHSLSKPLFEYTGYIRENSLSFTRESIGKVIEINENEDLRIVKNISFMFPNPEKGEYILKIIRRCGVYEEYRNQASLIIR